ncbi:MAG: imidazole glycerol phosphate synthase subunit HisH [Acidobacteria bacterium]|nr:imidazole glycerol phosphate synthase subunit HisH [Acidobacteriota bacterium]
MIALVDYGAGNLTSVKKAFAAIGAALFVPETPADLDRAAAVVVPGVGHFGATRALEGDWTSRILARLGEGRPLLGICLGMQWLFEGSAEADAAGLGLLAGACTRLDPRRAGAAAAPGSLKVPHVGWNALELRRETPLVDGVPTGTQVYFTHSYAAPLTGDTVAVTEHGEPFASIVQRGQVAGVQFHPEKSGEAGLRILRNFVELAG